MATENLRNRIKAKRAIIGVIGLGYVGLPLAILFAQKGFRVIGFARNTDKIVKMRKGITDIESVRGSVLMELQKKGNLTIEHIDAGLLDAVDAYFVCVPTPVHHNKKPDLTPVLDVANRLSRVNVTGKLIVNESTVAPQTTDKVFGGFQGTYYLACSPERIDPGNKSKHVENISKVVGGRDKTSLDLAVSLYESILDAPVVRVSSTQAAEMVKMLENTYRAVNIALVNEFARLADAAGLDILEIIEAAKSKWSFHAHYPGVGVGGHCIPVDPWYLVDYGKDKKIALPVVEYSLRENDDMADFVAQKIVKEYKSGKRVLIYGVTYKKNIKDTRETPIVRLCELLDKYNVKFGVYDPLLSPEEIRAIGLPYGKLRIVDIFVVGTDHDALRKDYKDAINTHTRIIDGRNYFSQKVGRGVLGVGRTLV